MIKCPVTVVREINRMGDSVAAVCRPPALFDNKTGGLQTAATESHWSESGHDLVRLLLRYDTNEAAPQTSRHVDFDDFKT